MKFYEFIIITIIDLLLNYLFKSHISMLLQFFIRVIFYLIKKNK